MLTFSLITLALAALAIGVLANSPSRPEPVRIRIEDQPVRRHRR